ncbi:gamma-aminobutyric-acid receptor subunit beta [Celerinatantimonas sp. YJH-8]|uniref:gamma-aminobutyric-acid receptor subunit beta n=1 Tax=Celerinatantimonas sp. YJH-8 TaxID=3228714 RepID=UPI0038C8162F
MMNLKRWMGLILTLMLYYPMSVRAQPLVDTSISINKIYGVNTVDQTYQIDGYLVTSWKLDQPSAFFPAQGEKICENSCVDTLIKSGLWVPAFEFINIIGKRQTANKRLVLTAAGGVIYNERFSGTFTTAMDFRKFPFDQQSFDIIMEPFSYEKSQLSFRHVSVFLEALENQTISEWDMTDKPVSRVTESVYHHIENDHPSYFSRLEVHIQAKRKPNYYIWQFLLPLSLILIASWSVFWIDGFTERLMTSFTMMLTVVAYTFYTSSLLPRLPYTTFIGRMVVLGYVSIFTAILVIVFVKIREEKQKTSFRIVHHCRYLFPLLSIIAVALLVEANHCL